MRRPEERATYHPEKATYHPENDPIHDSAVSVRRYNALLRKSINETKIGGNVEVASVYATLALAEATILGGKD